MPVEVKLIRACKYAILFFCKGTSLGNLNKFGAKT